MRHLNLSLVILLAAIVERSLTAKPPFTGPLDDDEDSEDEEFLEAACHDYKMCLEDYEKLSADCAAMEKGSKGQAEESDDCAAPVERLSDLLRIKKEQKKLQLRRCFEKGIIDDEGSRVPDLKMVKRHQATCANRLAEFEQQQKQRMRRATANAGVGDNARQCRAAAKRLRDRCDRMQSCCARAKVCRKELSKGQLASDIRRIVDEIKRKRKYCREVTKQQ